MAKKKDQMAEEVERQEQMDLIEVHPENAKAIVVAAKLYKRFQNARLTALAKEVAQKQVVLNLVREADLKPLNGGKIKFNYDNVKISVTPRDVLVKVKVKDEAEM